MTTTHDLIKQLIQSLAGNPTSAELEAFERDMATLEGSKRVDQIALALNNFILNRVGRAM